MVQGSAHPSPRLVNLIEYVMKLEDFLSETLVAIATGVNKANQKLEKKQYVVQTHSDHTVEFDIAVTVSKGKTEIAEGTLGADIKVFKSGVSGKKGNLKSDESISRIRFKVKPNLQID